MGRKKIEIKTLVSLAERRQSFYKRRAGILKKARELSILCDVPMMLLFFSPTDNKSHYIFLGEESTFEGMISRYGAVPPEERHKRKLDILEELKKKLDKDKKTDANQELTGRNPGQSEGENTQNGPSDPRLQRYLDTVNGVDDISLLEEIEAELLYALSENFEMKTIAATNVNQVANNVNGQFQVNPATDPPCHSQFLIKHEGLSSYQQFQVNHATDLSSWHQQLQVNHEAGCPSWKQQFQANDTVGASSPWQQFQANHTAGGSSPWHPQSQANHAAGASFSWHSQSQANHAPGASFSWHPQSQANHVPGVSPSWHPQSQANHAPGPSCQSQFQLNHEAGPSWHPQFQVNDAVGPSCHPFTAMRYATNNEEQLRRTSKGNAPMQDVASEEKFVKQENHYMVAPRRLELPTGTKEEEDRKRKGKAVEPRR